METAAPPPPPPPQISYADSLDSSPRSRHTDSWDSPPSSAASAKLRLMCSYGGHIVPRPHDKSLCYVGGTTRIVMVDRNTTLSALSNRLSSSLLDHRSFSLKYQLPNEDLDSLISVSTDEDLDNMIDEYDRLLAASSAAQKPSRLRLFLFPHSKTDSASSIGSLLDDSKTDNWFVDALNGTGVLPRGLSADSSSSNINCLLGLDDAAAGVDSKTPHLPDSTGKIAGQEIHSVPDSPMMETTSSFGSTSSASCLSNLPPIRVRVDDGGGARSQDLRSGLEEHFSHMTVGGVPAGTISPSVENPSRVLSDDERLEQGMPGMIRKPQQNTSQLQQILNVHELPTDAIIGDNSNPSGVISHQKSGYYQEPVVPMPVQERASATATAGSVSDQKKDISDSNYRIPVQVQDPGFISPLQQHEQQQFIHATPHYINPHLTGPVHISSYYQYQMHPQQHQQLHQQQQQQQQLHQQQQQQQQQLHQQQQQLHQQQQQQRFDQQQQQRFDQQYPMYFMPVGQNQAYNLAIQPNPSDPPSMPSSKPAFIPAAYKEPSPVHPARSAPPQKPELAANLLYRAAMPAPNQPFQNAAQFIHVSDQQHQYMGYHQLHHPPQSAAAAASPANFAYEFTDPSNGQIYYTQQKSAMLAPQYQTVSSGAMISEISLPPQTAADAKQNRTSQPL